MCGIPGRGKQEKADSSPCVFLPIAAAAAMGGLYRALGLARNASKTDIKNAYLRLAQRYHPDHQPQADAAACAEAARRFREAKDAYDVLSDDCCRAEYDRQLRRSSSSSSSSYRQGGSSASSSSSSNHENRHGGGTSGSSYSSSSSGYRHSGSSSSSSSKNYLVGVRTSCTKFFGNRQFFGQ
jgi:DnaJ-class molecular chaperone